MASKYKVEYIQVNINVGDCQIILLLEEKGGKDTIKYSVLIDGGEGHFFPMENIRQVFRRIANRYVTQGSFKLDAIVITHWDKDHYGGILELLKDSWYDKGKTVLKKGVTLTRLYVPYQPDNLDKFDKDFEVLQQNNESWLKIKGGDKICKYLGDMSEADMALLNGAPVAWDLKEKTSQLIGRNLFTNFRPTPPPNMANPMALVTAHNNGIPGLYCVAANNRFLGQGPGDATENTTFSNRSSIVCMVIDSDGTVSHYLGGDAHKELEDEIMKWTRLAALTQQVNNVDDKDRIAIVKASHHGSFTATPVKMCQTYKPKYFVFSAGNKYHHPMWEVLLYVTVYYRSFGKVISPKINDRDGILMTSFPHWMDRGAEHFPPPTSQEPPREERYRQTLTEFSGGVEAQNIHKLYKWAKKAQEKAEDIRVAKESKNKTAEDSAKKKKKKLEQKIRIMFKPILKACIPIHKDDRVFPAKEGKMTSHVSYISFMLDRPEPVEIVRKGPGFKSLPMKRSHSATPGPPGGGKPKRRRT